MTNIIHVADLPEFDPAEHLRDEADIAAYLTAVIEDGDPAELVRALGVAARSRGLSNLANAPGLAGEALSDALSADAQPQFDTVNRLCHALGVKLIVQPVSD